MRLSPAALVLACILAPAAICAQPAASDGPTSAPVATPSADPAVTARAKEWLHRAQTGTIDRSQLSAQMNSLLTDDLVKGVSAQMGSLGDPTGFTLIDMRSVAGSNIYLYKAQFKTAALEEILSLDATGKIDGLRFLPAH